jgi:hypothetical protein
MSAPAPHTSGGCKGDTHARPLAGSRTAARAPHSHRRVRRRSAGPSPGWISQISASDFALLERDLPAGLLINPNIGINAEARAMALGYTDAEGNFVRQDSHALEVMQQIDADGGDAHSVHIRVAIVDSPERAQILARDSVGSDLVGVNELGDPRLTVDGGSRVAQGVGLYSLPRCLRALQHDRAHR